MKTEPVVNSYNHFTELQVFENSEINNSLDEIYSLILDNFNEVSSIKVCGSVAKILDGKFSENYKPKDIDLVLFSNLYWRFLIVNIYKISAESITILDERIIINFNKYLIEIWKVYENHTINKLYKNKISYCYVN